MYLAEAVEHMERNEFPRDSIHSTLTAILAQFSTSSNPDRIAVLSAFASRTGLEDMVDVHQPAISPGVLVAVDMYHTGEQIPITFVDLPGYKSADVGREDIKRLNSRIARENRETLILHVVNCMKDNFRDIPSLQEVKDLDFESVRTPSGETKTLYGQRTINVFTSFDRTFNEANGVTNGFQNMELLVGPYRQWVSELEKQRLDLQSVRSATAKSAIVQTATFSTLHGYTMVKNRTTPQRARGETIPQAKEAAKGEYENWNAQRSDLFILDGADASVGADNLNARVIEILSFRMQVLFAPILSHLMGTIEHLECKQRQLLRQHGGNHKVQTTRMNALIQGHEATPLVGRTWHEIVDEFRQNVGGTIRIFTEHTLPRIVEHNVMPLADFEKLVVAEDLAKQLGLQFRLPSEIEDVRRQEEFLSAAWRAVQRTCLRALRPSIDNLVTEVKLSLGKSAFKDALNLKPLDDGFYVDLLRDINISEEIIATFENEVEQFHQKAVTQKFDELVTPVAVLKDMVLELLHDAVDSVSNETANVNIAAALDEMVKAPFNTFYNANWYRKGVNAARREALIRTLNSRLVDASSLKLPDANNARDVAWAIAEFYKINVSRVRTIVVNHLTATMRQALQGRIANADVGRWVKQRRISMDSHSGWRAAWNFVNDKLKVYSEALGRVLTEIYDLPVNANPYRLVPHRPGTVDRSTDSDHKEDGDDSSTPEI